MRYIGRLVGLLLACLALAAQAEDQAAWKALREGRAVLLMRHAQAPGLGDPAGFRLDDCSTQRNLDAAGRRQAQAWGQQLRLQRIERPRLFSSCWCRALETTRELGLGTVQPMP
ncbi:MAG: histidine phosphatase family protein, partial [Pseudomonadota bacterium]